MNQSEQEKCIIENVITKNNNDNELNLSVKCILACQALIGVRHTSYRYRNSNQLISNQCTDKKFLSLD